MLNIIIGEVMIKKNILVPIGKYVTLLLEKYELSVCDMYRTNEDFKRYLEHNYALIESNEFDNGIKYVDSKLDVMIRSDILLRSELRIKNENTI
jgi:hypothetical protein